MIVLCAIFNMIKNIFLDIKNYFIDAYKNGIFFDIFKTICILVLIVVAVVAAFSLPYIPFIIAAISFYKDKSYISKKDKSQFYLFFPVSLLMFIFLFIFMGPDQLPTNPIYKIIVKSVVANTFTFIFGFAVTGCLWQGAKIVKSLYTNLKISFDENYNTCKNKKDIK